METVEEMVTITKAEYDRLRDNEDWLDCLSVAGVDNWDGYDEAGRIYRETENDCE